MSHVTHISESCHTHKWIMSHTHLYDQFIHRFHFTVPSCVFVEMCVWHDLFMCVTWLTYMCDMTHPYYTLQMFKYSHAAPWHVCVCGMTYSYVRPDSSISHVEDVEVISCLHPDTHSYVWHDSFICVAWLIHVCDMTHPNMRHTSSTCATWLIHMCDPWERLEVELICVAWLIHMCDMTHPYVSRVGASWSRTHMCGMTHPYVRHDSSICATWLIHMCDMTHPYVGRVGNLGVELIYVTWLIHTCDMTHPHVWLLGASWSETHMCDMTHAYVGVWEYLGVQLICATWLMHMCDMTHPHVWPAEASWSRTHVCDMTHSYVWHDSLICVAWLIHMCDMTRPSLRHNSSTCATGLIRKCDMTHLYVWHDSFICVAWLIHMRDTWLVNVCDQNSLAVNEWRVLMCCSVLQCVAACCSALQCVAAVRHD